MDFVLFWSVLPTRESIVEVTEQFWSDNERKNERRVERISSLASGIPRILPSCPAVGTPVGLHLPR